MVIACAYAVAGCGGDGGGVDAQPPGDTAATTATPTATAAGAPVPTATATAGPAATPTVAPEAEAGDEAGNRVEVRFALLGRRIDPDRREVPAFLGLTLVLRNASGAARTVQLDGNPVADVAPGATEVVEVEGLQPGEHLLSAGVSALATIDARRAGE